MKTRVGIGDVTTVTSTVAAQATSVTEKGRLVALIIDQAQAGAAIELLDADDVSLGIKLDLDVKGRQDYEIDLTNGLHYTTTGLTTGRVHILAVPEVRL